MNERKHDQQASEPKRDRSLRMRMNDKELAALDKVAGRFGCSRSAAVRIMCEHELTGETALRPIAIAPADRLLVEELHAIQRELRKIGINLNQMARALNIACSANGGSVYLSVTSILSAFSKAGITPQSVGEGRYLYGLINNLAVLDNHVTKLTAAVEAARLGVAAKAA